MKISSDKEISETTASVILDTTNWGPVTIGVQKSCGEINKYCMEIQAATPGTLVEMVLALMKRIKVWKSEAILLFLDIFPFKKKEKKNLLKVYTFFFLLYPERFCEILAFMIIIS